MNNTVYVRHANDYVNVLKQDVTSHLRLYESEIILSQRSFQHVKYVCRTKKLAVTALQCVTIIIFQSSIFKIGTAAKLFLII